MPAVGWKTKAGLFVPFDDAIRVAREEGAFEKFPAPVLAAMENRRDDGFWLSPSSATRCNRQRVLQSEYDYYQDLEGSWPPFIGNAVHGQIATGIRNRWGIHSNMLEERWKTLDLTVHLRDDTTHAFTLQGTPDVFDMDQNTLYDWKTIGDFVYYDTELKQKVTRVLPYPEHEIQINLYALLYQPLVTRAFVWYVKSEGKKEVTRRLVPVTLYDPQEAYDLACELAEPLAWAEKTGELPNERFDPNNYICKGCPVQDICKHLASVADDTGL